MNLLHLVSEQTVQNLLPILAIRPKRVVQVRSRDPRFAKAAANLQSAVAAMRSSPRYGDFDPEFFEQIIDADSPGLDETCAAIDRTLALWPGCVVNLTGGTKLMSIGAWISAERNHEPVLYCDTARRSFLWQGRYPDKAPAITPFETVAASLTVETVMAAQGIAPHAWRFSKATPDLIAFGETAYRIKTAHRDLFAVFNTRIRDHFRPDKQRIPKSKTKLAELWACPLPESEEPPVRDFLGAAAIAGLLRKASNGQFFPAGNPDRSTLERTANLLDGSWLELYVLSLLERSNGRFTDPRWSVQSLDETQSVIGENDVVCIDSTRACLKLISCKTSPPTKPLEHLTSLAERRRALGGSHASATLAILAASGEQADRLRKWSELLGVELLIGSELDRLPIIQHCPASPIR